MINCTLLNPAVDVVYSVEEFRPGSTLTDLPSETLPAGKGINVARVVKTLGEEVRVTGLLPELDHGRFAEFLDAQGIGHDLFRVPGSVRINATFTERTTGLVTHFNAAGSSYASRLQEEFLTFQRGLVKGGDIWSFSGSIPRGFDRSVYADLIRQCAGGKAHALLDTRDSALTMGVRAKPLMVKPNLTELEGFFGEPIKGVHHIALKGKRLLDVGISYVFVSLGADGMIAIHENDCLLCSPPQVTVVDTVGCGDALVAGLLVACTRGFSFSETCRMAVACGASKAMHRGPGVVTRDEVWQLMEDVRITAV